jgi:S-adenosylmethionine decarboxylase
LVSVYQVYRADVVAARKDHLQRYAAQHNERSLLQRLNAAANALNVSVVAQSVHPFAPHGSSGLILGGVDRDSALSSSAQLHLEQSHACAHSYPDWFGDEGRGWSRVDYSICTCGAIGPLAALPHLLGGHDQLAAVDLCWRGPWSNGESSAVVRDEIDGYCPSWEVVDFSQTNRHARWILQNRVNPSHDRELVGRI